MYLLDTNVVSELRRAGTGKTSRDFEEWQQSVDPAEFHLSAITLMEIEIGVLLMERRDAVQGGELRRWVEQRMLPGFEGRIISVDGAVALRCAALHVPDRRPERDALIAATVLVHGITLVTRNVRDFAIVGLSLVNPWEGAVKPA